MYVVDTSSLIDLQENYPRNIFPKVWTNFESLIQGGNIVAPIEVFREISPSNTVLHRWCMNYRRIFHQNNQTIINFVAEIMRDFPNLVDPNKMGPVADPFIIALARQLGGRQLDVPIIITQEKNRPNKIPHVANSYNITSMDLLDFFNNENWQF